MSLIFSPVKNASSSSTTSSVFQMITLNSQELGFRGLMSTFISLQLKPWRYGRLCNFSSPASWATGGPLGTCPPTSPACPALFPACPGGKGRGSPHALAPDTCPHRADPPSDGGHSGPAAPPELKFKMSSSWYPFNDIQNDVPKGLVSVKEIGSWEESHNDDNTANLKGAGSR